MCFQRSLGCSWTTLYYESSTVNHVSHVTVSYTLKFVYIQMQKGLPRLLQDALFNMRGQKWKQSRSILTPAFSAAKLRQVTYSSYEIMNFLQMCVCDL